MSFFILRNRRRHIQFNWELFLAENKIEYIEMQQNELIYVFLAPKLGEVYK